MSGRTRVSRSRRSSGIRRPTSSRRLRSRRLPARRSRNGGRSSTAAIALMHRIHDEFRFDPGSTSITTPATRVLEERHGVCQDFAHLQIACLRSLGLPARYVSGYLLTDPPPGQPRLVGADASHAWLSVWCPRERLGRSRPHQCRPPRHEACDDCLGTRLRGREPAARRRARRRLPRTLRRRQRRPVVVASAFRNGRLKPAATPA